MKNEITKYIDSHRKEMLDLYEALVMQESYFDDKEGVDKVSEIIKAELEKIGGSVQIHKYDNVGNMLVGTVGGDRAEQPIVFIGHMDTVLPKGTTADRPFKIENGKVYGPGVLDMKGGIVIALYVIKALQAAGYNKRPIKWLLAGDEESTHQNSDQPEKIKLEAAGSIAAFNFETGSPSDNIVVGRKGIQRFIFEVYGVAAHVGNDPENGRNAIWEMSNKIIDIQNLTDFEIGTTYNVGTIIGGTVPNATPDYCKIVVDVRHKYVNDAENIINNMRKIADKTYIQGTKTKLSIALPFMPMEQTEENMQLFNIFKETSIEEGFGTPNPVCSGGASDSAYSVIAGVPTICAVGVKGGRNHTPEEFAFVESLFERAKLLSMSILKI